VRPRTLKSGARSQALSLVVLAAALVGLIGELPLATQAQAIDRRALVSRHNVTFRKIDPTSPAMVGNGNFAFTADITGLQTFPEQYSPLVPLLTEAQWGWHSFPNPSHFNYADSLVSVPVHGSTQYYPWLHDWSDAEKPVIKWLRENPHRISLGRLSLYLAARDGKPALYSQLAATRQTLDLWSGRLQSRFELEGETVEVQTSVHPDLDMLIVTLRSPLLTAGRLGLSLKFPGVASTLNPDPADRARNTARVSASRRPSGRASPPSIPAAKPGRRQDLTKYY